MQAGSQKLNKVETTTGVNPAGDAGDTSPNILVGGRQREYPFKYYYVLSDIVDQYRLGTGKENTFVPSVVPSHRRLRKTLYLASQTSPKYAISRS